MNPSSTLAVVGGAAGGVCVVSLSKGEVVTVLGGHTEGESIEAVVFVDIAGSSGVGPGVAVTGATDGKICIWDLTTMRLRHKLQHKVRHQHHSSVLIPELQCNVHYLGCHHHLAVTSVTQGILVSFRFC